MPHVSPTRLALVSLSFTSFILPPVVAQQKIATSVAFQDRTSANMPTTRTGRQSSPSKEGDSPSKMRVQPMRGARLRSASPFFDAASATTGAAASQPSQSSSQASSPSISTRSSPRKRGVAAATSSLQPPTRRSTRSRSRSVDPDSLSSIDESPSLPTTRNASEVPDSELEVDQSTFIQASHAGPAQSEATASPEPRLLPIAEEGGAMASTGSPFVADDEDPASSSSSSSSSDSDVASSSSSNSHSSSSESASDDDETDETLQDLDSLLKASQQAYKSRASAPAIKSGFEDNQDVISFGTLTDGTQNSKRVGKAMPLVLKAKFQTANSQPASTKGQSRSKDQLDAQIEALDQGALAPDQKRSKHARAVQTSAGSAWFDMPEFGASSSRLSALKKQSAADSGHSPRRSNCVEKCRLCVYATRSTPNASTELRPKIRPCPSLLSLARLSPRHSSPRLCSRAKREAALSWKSSFATPKPLRTPSANLPNRKQATGQTTMGAVSLRPRKGEHEPLSPDPRQLLQHLCTGTPTVAV